MLVAVMHSFSLKFGFHSAVDEHLVVSVLIGACVCPLVHACEDQRMWESSWDASALHLGQDVQFAPQTIAQRLPLTSIKRKLHFLHIIVHTWRCSFKIFSQSDRYKLLSLCGLIFHLFSQKLDCQNFVRVYHFFVLAFLQNFYLFRWPIFPLGCLSFLITS